jgi:hypothetical protein
VRDAARDWAGEAAAAAAAAAAAFFAWPGGMNVAFLTCPGGAPLLPLPGANAPTACLA